MSYQEIIKKIELCEQECNPLTISSADEVVREFVYLMSVFKSKSSKVVFVIPTQRDLENWTEKLKLLLSGYSSEKIDVYPLPYISNFGTDRYLDHRLYKIQRLAALQNSCRKMKKSVYITTLTALSQWTSNVKKFGENTKSISIGQEVDVERLAEDLTELGYKESPSVETEGLFSTRGGIIDLFSPGAKHPVRIEIFLDLVKSMRNFDRLTQRSINEVKEVVIGPASEFFFSQESRPDITQKLFEHLIAEKVPIADTNDLLENFKNQFENNDLNLFLPALIADRDKTIDFFREDSLFVFPRTLNLTVDEYENAIREFELLTKEDRAKGRPASRVQVCFCDRFVDLVSTTKLDRSINIGFSKEDGKNSSSYGIRKLLFDSVVDDPLEKWVGKLRELQRDGMYIAIIAQNSDRIDRIFYLLKGYGFSKVQRENRYLQDLVGKDSEKIDGSIEIGYGYLCSPIILDQKQLAIVPDYELLGISPKVRRSTKEKHRSAFQSFTDLIPSNLVVHHIHGVGRYLGLSRMAFGGVETEFLIIEYAGLDKIYLPIDRLNILSRYEAVNAGYDRPLDRLGGSFIQKKRKVKVEAIAFARVLLSEQAKREVARGIVYGEVSETYLRMEADFPYEETDDQLHALMEIDADFVSGKPMDRLICGDVGFGKTEVALRAAMRTVLEGYQVLIFVPTTLLCHQHFQTFSNRLEKYAINIAEVNRYISSRKIKEALETFNQGRLDVLIGTHMLLTKEVKPKNLGLIVIDEEQRFGVHHKENLKKIRSEAHIISLSATPIPRTLHQALVGLREISIIATPPRQRLPVKTSIAPFDPMLVKRAVDQELKRGGQVFFVHNRVEEIDAFADQLAKMVPDARIAVAHGQMPEHRLEKVVKEFIERKYDILLCTTIIEAGVDMPNVNTLVVNNAERFGLSQLYQIRGRVGRSHVQAYAYLLTNSKTKLSHEAQSRLEIIASHQELGAGFHIANRDLEIRGAGDLLGEAQSGHVNEVGMETYRTLLTEAINELKGEKVTSNYEVEIKLPISIIIPDTYIKAEKERIAFYKEIFSVLDEDVLADVLEKIKDRFGEPPEDVVILFKFARLKLQLVRVHMTSLIYRNGGLECRFINIEPSIRANILSLIDTNPQRYLALPKDTLLINLHDPNIVKDSAIFLETISIEINNIMYNKNMGTALDLSPNYDL